ncbi:TPA: hypothetical protein QHS09_003306 [Enterobacter roggenkampii]|nr:hypothetical protein [Enterobacter roggenkampii]
MSNIDKQTHADDESLKIYYIHPAAFGSTKNPGYGHVPVVHADDFEKQRAKLVAAEKRIGELEAREVMLPQRFDVQSHSCSEEPDGEWYARDDVLAALATAGVRSSEEGEHD